MTQAIELKEKRAYYTFLVFLSSLLFMSLVVPEANAYSNSVTDDWPMFHHDPMHTGYSTSNSPGTNKTLWTYKTNSAIGSPAIVDGRVYVGSNNGNIYCLNAFDGTFLWNYQTGGEVEGCPAVVKNRVYIGSEDQNIYCLEAYTGAKMWNFTTGGAIRSSPTVSEGRVFVGSYDGNVYAFNASNGSLIWKYQSGGAVHSSPAVSGNNLYVGSNDRNFYCLNISDGTAIWRFNIGNWVGSSPAFAEGRVYFGTDGSYMYALNASNGEVSWQYATTYGVSSSPAVAQGRVYVGSRDLNIHCLNATNGAQLWKFKTTAWITCSPAVANGKVYAGEGMHVHAFTSDFFCLDASSGSAIWKFTANYTGIWTSSSPAVAYGNVYLGTDDGYIYAFGSPQPVPPEVVVVSPVNQTYNISSVSLVFTVNEPVAWMGYALDDAEMVTITGNITLTNLPNGLHGVTVFANDTFGSIGTSETISFSIDVPETFPHLIVVVASIAIALTAGLILYSKKRRH